MANVRVEIERKATIWVEVGGTEHAFTEDEAESLRDELDDALTEARDD